MRHLVAIFMAFLGGCGDDGTSTCDCTDDEACVDGACVPLGGDTTGATTAAGTGNGASTTGAGATAGSTGAGATMGCHLSCACYEPPFHPTEIDCATACANVNASCTGDPSCWTCTYAQSQAECLESCNGIAATWSQPNVATYLADVVYGCGMQNPSCSGMTSCNDEIVAQQEGVCP